ncbi:MAG: 2-dehydropantoate 2-reductase [Burkholderiaceae bacterium]|nr:2-dehydropantoate 2-reductase [Burkholderiaceae bacterium]
MNFIILGAGAVGCYVGGRLAAAGERVALVGRPRAMAPLMQGGLTVTDLDGFMAQVPADRLHLATSLAAAWTQAGTTASAPTVILLCVKGGATAAAAQEIAACCPPGTVVVSLQNGMDNVARITRAAPQMQTLAGMVPYNVVMKSPTQVHRATAGRLHIESTPVSESMAAILNAAGLGTRLSANMRDVQWGKLLLNLNNPINALSDLPLREQLLSRDFRKVLAALQLEALAAMSRAGIEPAQMAAAPPRTLPRVLALPNWLFTRVASRMLRMDASARSSMWDDVQQGRTTEIDDMCGAVVALAAQTGTAAPRNAAMCKLMAAHSKGQRWTGPDLRKALKL